MSTRRPKLASAPKQPGPPSPEPAADEQEGVLAPPAPAPAPAPAPGDDGDDNPPVDPESLLIGADQFVENASLSIPFAGLLADQPELADPEKKLTRAEWQAHLDSYLKSERP